jgi:hypothetical protein
MGLPNFKDRTPAAAPFLYYFFDGVAPHAEGNADSFVFIGDTHEDDALFLFFSL